jgi:hypothetical protein
VARHRLGWPGRLSDQSGRKAEDVLSPTHLQIYKALAKRGGVGKNSDIVAEVEAGIVKNTIFSQIHQASFLYMIGPWLYALLGWRLSEDDTLMAVADAGDGDLVMVVKRPAAASPAAGSQVHRERRYERSSGSGIA